MPKSRGPAPEIPQLKTITVERLNYGRRYTWLPVDTVDQDGFTIDCTNTYMQPVMYDLRINDIIRWSHNGLKIQGVIASIKRTETTIVVQLKDVAPLPPDFFAG